MPHEQFHSRLTSIAFKLAKQILPQHFDNFVPIKKPLFQAFKWVLYLFCVWLFCGGYFPIQKRLKILPSTSSVVICPVISPKKCRHSRTS